MPELPEVEAVCAKLRETALGLRITGARVLRCGTPRVAALAPGRTLDGVDRKGKHILMRLSGGVTLHTHLRMSGNLFWIPDHRFHSPRARVILELAGGGGVVLEDARALAKMDAAPSEEVDAALGELGPEPFSPEFTEEWFVAVAKQAKQASKIFLMDQTKVAGLGNIYAAEALFRAKVNPRKPMNRLSVLKLRALHAQIVEVFRDAVQSAVLAYSGPGEFQEAERFPLAVYGRESECCLSCNRKIKRIAQGGRSTYFCPNCQR